MRLVGQLSSACKLAREHTSLHLDGELSEFEQVALDAHLTNCAGCRAYGASMTEATTRLRSTRLEQPDFPVVLPHRSRIRVPLRTAQLAAAAVVVAVVGFSAASVTPGRERSLSGSGANTLVDRGPNLSPGRLTRATFDVRVARTAPRPVRTGSEIV
jgi:predicted anti-sigma-YlaC factor YlaD